MTYAGNPYAGAPYAGASGATTVADLVATTNNRVGGRRRSGLAVATWDPAVDATPAGLMLATAYDTANAFGPVTMNGTQPTYTVSTAKTLRHRDRIVVGGVDITYFRGIPTPLPTIQLLAPLLYGPATLTLPQVSACFERLGVGELKWAKKGSKVKVQRVDTTTGAVVATDYLGIIVAFDTNGRDLTIQIGGEASGRAALRNRQIPIFRSVHDIGRYAFRGIHELGLKFKPRLGPTTGIELANFGGTSQLDYLNQLCAKAWTKAGNQFTIMPDAGGVYRMQRKDTTTINGTVYLDDARTVANLRRDVAEEPNRIYGTTVTPGGQRVRFGVYPGLKQTDAPPYPMTNGSTFGEGTTDAQTNTGDGVTVMIGRLQVVGYLTRRQSPGGYDAQVTKAIEALQEDAGLAVTGNMSPTTWRALYDLDATGFSLAWSHIEPAAQKSKVREWNRSGSGAIMSRNPNYEPGALVVDRNIDFGAGFERGQVREWARAELVGSEDNWVGTIDFNTGALVAGSHTPGNPIAAADVMRARDLRPGMNLRAPLFDGGITLHVSGVTITTDGKVQATVDTRARDTMPVWEVIRRNRESRQDPARAWLRDHRASTEIKDALIEWDEVGGVLGDKVTLPANTWVVFPVVAGQEGTVRALRMDLAPAAEYVVAVFGRKITPGRLKRLVGNPLTKGGTKRWAKESTRDALDSKNILLYAAGDNANPCGYYPKQKTAEGDQTGGTEAAPTSDPVAPLTGRWEDDAGFSYHTGEDPVLWVAVYADRATAVPAGRIMWNQLEAGA